MTKIREIIEISGGYTSYVDLYAEYNKPEDNQTRMQRYRPITAHRLAFEKIANSLNPRDRRFYFLSGSYGTGKSHLLLMLANYFSLPSDLPEMEEFFKGYEQSQSQVMLKPGEVLNERTAATLKAYRSSSRFLVALCNFEWNLDFEGAIIRAVEEAFERENVNFELDSHYQEAIRRLKDWEDRKGEAPFYNRFHSALAQHGDWTMNSLLNELKNRKESALDTFKQCFSEATDTDFSYKKDNLRDILGEILASEEFKSHFKGIVVFYDEFGYALDDGLVNLSRLHGFAQFCANTGMDSLPLIFIGSGHKNFRNHGKVSDSVHYNTLAARVNEIALQTQGMEDIISAIVHPKKEHPVWEEDVLPHSGIFTWFSGECRRLGLFDWLIAPKIRSNIIENIYPMHPLATFAVLRLAEEAGSDNRSVFKFFSPEFDSDNGEWKNIQDYSFPWFIDRNATIVNGKLNLYTADRLVDYFRDSLSTENTKLIDRIKKSIVNYEATLRALNQYLEREKQNRLFEDADQLILRIIKVMLIHEIISNEKTTILNTFENICFSLFAMGDQEKIQIKNRLEYLCEAVVIYKNDNNIYELTPGDRKDIQRLIDQYKANPANRPNNLLQSFLNLSPLKADESFLEAKDYNLTYNEDKRLKVVFATPSMFEETKNLDGVDFDFFSILEYQRGEVDSANDGYEGTAVFIFCENDADIEAAKKMISNNMQERVILALPKNPFPLFDAIFTLNALNNLQQSKDYENFGALEKVQIKNIKDSAVEVLAQAKNFYFSNKNLTWFGEKGKRLTVQENKPHDVANTIMEGLFVGKRNTFPHPDFNRVHIRLSGRTLGILKEAGDILLDLSKTIRINWSWPDNRGGNHYLRKCFVDNQVLKILDSQGDDRFFKAEENISKFNDQVPAYAQMLKDLAALEDRGPVVFKEFIQPFFEDFGQGVTAVSLMLLMARRYYGDGLRFKHQPDALTDLRFSSTDEVLSLINGEFPNAVLLFETVSKEDRKYFETIVKIFSSNSAKADKQYGISDAYDAVYAWWEDLPTIAKSVSFHEGEFEQFYNLMDQINTKDPFNFIKHDLVEVLGLVPGEKITEAKVAQIDDLLTIIKEFTEKVLVSVQNQILQEVKDIFNAKEALQYDIREAILGWYRNKLTALQKEPYSKFHNDDSKPLIVEIKHFESTEEFLFKDLPEAYGLRSVKNWNTNLISDYLNKIKRGKQHIEDNAPDVPEFHFELSETDNRIIETENEIRDVHVTYNGELTVKVATENQKGHIYFTENGSDPSVDNNARQLLSQNQELIVKSNKKLMFVVLDDQGNPGLVTTINAINDLDKYRITRSKQMPLGDELVNFIFPVDKGSAGVTLSSLINELEKSDWISLPEIMKIIQEIIENLENQK